jgi:hypothetical protein
MQYLFNALAYFDTIVSYARKMFMKSSPERYWMATDAAEPGSDVTKLFCVVI